ncbi:hypothetical protein EF914_35065 [Streptomyces sp. WAC05458]|nr:hypothetical protein E5N77_12045 [Streptomyces sp. SS52]RSS12053.1 hypothetical protein EF914_35065 [Streptomyces sp. WAC05458]RSS12919.1 hypothetical protein EF915_20310 [Streptomyces sp. WAC08401]RSS71351.1 hypothetical protein EF907_03285 [Streptomyces sp. WAC06273]
MPQSSGPLPLRSRSERTRWATESGIRSPTLSLTTWYALSANCLPCWAADSAVLRTAGFCAT